MGKALALNFASKGINTIVTNPILPGEGSVTNDFIQSLSQHNITGAPDIPQFLSKLRHPRCILLMIKAGVPVDEVLRRMEPDLVKGDIIIDGGNSHYKDTERRQALLKEKGVHFVGMGVSGGEEGALYGPSIMPSGDKAVVETLMPMFRKVAARQGDIICAEWVGSGGSGHFVKMVHNGIEYADMQIISEVYALSRFGLGTSPDTLAQWMGKWNNGITASYLLEITIDILRKNENGALILDQILDVAGSKGTGLWTVQAALELGIPAPVIFASLNQRLTSTFKEIRIRLDKPHTLLQEVLTPDDFENTMLFSRIVALTEGFHLIKAASDQNEWSINPQSLTRIWSGGCIIRSALLHSYGQWLKNQPDKAHGFELEGAANLLARTLPAVKKVVKHANEVSIPIPGISSALQSWHSFHSGSLPVNLIQAQRDYFGAHTYRRLDGGDQDIHTNWKG